MEREDHLLLLLQQEQRQCEVEALDKIDIDYADPAYAEFGAATRFSSRKSRKNR